MVKTVWLEVAISVSFRLVSPHFDLCFLEHILWLNVPPLVSTLAILAQLWRGCLALIGSYLGRAMFQVSAAETEKADMVTIYYFWWLIIGRFVFHGCFDGCSLQSYHLSPNTSIFQPLSTSKIYYLSLWVKRLFIWSISWFPREKLWRFRREMTDLKIWKSKTRLQERCSRCLFGGNIESIHPKNAMWLFYLDLLNTSKYHMLEFNIV